MRCCVYFAIHAIKRDEPNSSADGMIGAYLFLAMTIVTWVYASASLTRRRHCIAGHRAGQDVRWGVAALGEEEALSAYDHLQAACRSFAVHREAQLEAMTSHVMALLNARFGVGVDDLCNHPDLGVPD